MWGPSAPTFFKAFPGSRAPPDPPMRPRKSGQTAFRYPGWVPVYGLSGAPAPRTGRKRVKNHWGITKIIGKLQKTTKIDPNHRKTTKNAFPRARQLRAAAPGWPSSSSRRRCPSCPARAWTRHDVRQHDTNVVVETVPAPQNRHLVILLPSTLSPSSAPASPAARPTLNHPLYRRRRTLHAAPRLEREAGNRSNRGRHRTKAQGREREGRTRESNPKTKEPGTRETLESTSKQLLLAKRWRRVEVATSGLPELQSVHVQ